MRAHLHSVRLAPKKANLMARMVRGMPVPKALTLLESTTKKSARIFETLLRSAMANAQHNDKQDPRKMIIKTIIVNQGTAYRRGVPMARGRVRPIRKFLSHITMQLGIAEQTEKIQKDEKSATNAKSRKNTKSATMARKSPKSSQPSSSSH